MNSSRPSGTRRLLGFIARAFLLFVLIAAGNLLAMYVAAGVALNGDWERVDNAVVRAVDGFFQ